MLRLGLVLVMMVLLAPVVEADVKVGVCAPGLATKVGHSAPVVVFVGAGAFAGPPWFFLVLVESAFDERCPYAAAAIALA